MKLKELLNILQKTSIEIDSSVPMICGGTPRDKILNRLDNISDLDITTGDKSISLLSEKFAEELKKKYNVTRKTMDDGHSSIFVGNLKIDFSSNFNAPNIDILLKQQGIDNPTSLQKEMFSRDFTCNALLMSTDLKKIYDPTKNGIQDIKDKKIKTCLSPDITLTSNRNRVIRAIYLACKLGFDIDESIIDFVKNHPNSVKISTERSLTEKLDQAFEKDGEKAASLLSKMGLWNYIPITKLVYPYYSNQIKGK